MPGTFSPPPRVSYPDMHHGTCATCGMPGSLKAVSFEVCGGENVPSVPGTCTNRNFTYLARGPCLRTSFTKAIWRHIFGSSPNLKAIKVGCNFINRDWIKPGREYMITTVVCCVMVISHPFPSFISGSAKTAVNLGHGWMITYRCLMWMECLVDKWSPRSLRGGPATELLHRLLKLKSDLSNANIPRGFEVLRDLLVIHPTFVWRKDLANTN